MSVGAYFLILFFLLFLLLLGFVLIFIKNLLFDRRNEYSFERDYRNAINTKVKKRRLATQEVIEIGMTNRKPVLIPTDAKHVFICGTTGSGKTVAISNFIKSGFENDYPMLIIDGKGDTDTDSLLALTQTICQDRKIYTINLNDPANSDKYNPFKNTSVDIIKDMLINMTNWTEPHYQYNTERYIQRLCKLLSLQGHTVTFNTVISFLPPDIFMKLSRDLAFHNSISQEEHLENINLAKVSGAIAESAVARFATIQESCLGQIFDENGIDIYTALEQNAIIIFILNPLLYPETSPLFGNLAIIDSKKATSEFFRKKKKRIFYILDEINSYANDSLLDLVNKSRSANITCILATQSLSDLEKVSAQFKDQIIENCNNYIVLRQNSPVNAEHWSEVIGTQPSFQPTYQVTSEDGGVKSTDVGSIRPTKEFIFHPDIIKRLGTGQAIFLSKDGDMYFSKILINRPFFNIEPKLPPEPEPLPEPLPEPKLKTVMEFAHQKNVAKQTIYRHIKKANNPDITIKIDNTIHITRFGEIYLSEKLEIAKQFQFNDKP